MSQFELVGFGRKEYPAGIPIRLYTLPGDFDIQPFRVDVPYILNTEKAFYPSRFSSSALDTCDEIGRWQIEQFPQLWSNDRWAAQFALFILRLTQFSAPPEVIELYPPFFNCGGDIEEFLDRYSVFEYFIQRVYPETELVLLNRHTSFNRFGYLISKAEELAETAELLRRKRLSLKIGVDIPELLIFEKAFTPSRIRYVFETLSPIRDSVSGFHLRVPGFRLDARAWDAVLFYLMELTNDDKVRYLVPEVKERRNLAHLIYDLRKAGADFGWHGDFYEQRSCKKNNKG